MHEQLAKYSSKLIADRAAEHDGIAFAAKDDVIVLHGDKTLTTLAESVLEKLNCLAIVAARPSLPFANLLIQKTAADKNVIIPRDTETRTFLHDIPFIRQSELCGSHAEQIASLLGNRKGIVVENIGIIATGALTVEQAYINWSSLFHSIYIKYLEDLLQTGFTIDGEMEKFNQFRHDWLLPLTADKLEFRCGPIQNRAEILEEIATVGRYTVQQGLVDSFFGNISYRYGDIIYISQTASSLDELQGCIDPVPFENSSTVGITASSELVAHRGIFSQTDSLAVLHGHPRFAVIMSMLCNEQNECGITDCWRDCVKKREIEGVPIVAGEIGAGGLADNVPPAIGTTGRVIVYGHGVFTIGKSDFRDAFMALVDVENLCRKAYFKRLDELTGC